MRAKVLIIPDKFKGTLSAEKAARAIGRGWAEGRPNDRLTLLPLSDGGDGFGKIIGALLSARIQRVKTVDAAHRPIVANWWWEPQAKTAIIESAAVIGLAQLPHGGYHPFELDTFGLGKVLVAATEKGARRCIIGIGGSATNDGGFGMARSLGWQFFDQKPNEITQWTDLVRLTSIRAGKPRFEEILVAVDVQNPLLGFKGATRVYGPQKGLLPCDFDEAERALRQLAAVTKHFAGVNYNRQPGAGAAGGLGFGLMAFVGARMTSGFELFVELSRLNSRLHDADLVITGEGSIDRSTLMGKGVGEIAERCRRLGIPCHGLGGVVSPDAAKSRLFTETRALTELTSKESALAKPAYWLRRLANWAARDWNPWT